MKARTVVGTGGEEPAFELRPCRDEARERKNAKTIDGISKKTTKNVYVGLLFV